MKTFRIVIELRANDYLDAHEALKKALTVINTGKPLAFTVDHKVVQLPN